MPQITIRLRPELKRSLDTYAEELGLDASDLIKLVVAREGKLHRLHDLKSQGHPPRRLRQKRGSAEALQSVTARVSEKRRMEFDYYASCCGLNRNNAGAWLLEKELDERWLEWALRQR